MPHIIDPDSGDIIEVEEIEPLDPELGGSLVVRGSLGRFIHHPLLVAPYSPSVNHLFNRQLAFRKKEVQQARQDQNWHRFLMLHERPYRMEAFMLIRDHMSDAEFWDAVQWLWTDSENIFENLDEWKELWADRDETRTQVMTPEDLEALKSLPDVVTVYRGQQDSKLHGISWTLDGLRAEWFAKRYRLRGYLFTGQVSKDDILAYFTGRSELEVVVLEDNVFNVKRTLLSPNQSKPD